jgi:oligopeptide/dipeptide ABC transporter ATP-binding protein
MSEQPEIILRVKDLRISFRTVSGKVQAVRGVSFDLEKGKTLAIVGESGSGKSVTNRAIMGILAKNGIVESGEILFDGKDLLKISEKEYCRIRGDKIAMIFQDPLSSLNPIIRIGRQLTEATLLKNRANRRDAKDNFEEITSALEKAMVGANANDTACIEKDKTYIASFRAVEASYLKVQPDYDAAYNTLGDVKADVDDLIFNIENKVTFDLKELIKELIRFNQHLVHPYVVPEKQTINDSLETTLKSLTRRGKKAKTYEPLLPELKKLQALVDGLLAAERPDLFAYCYYDLNVKTPLDAKLSVSEKNAITVKAMKVGLIDPLNQEIAKALAYSHDGSLAATKIALQALKDKRSIFTKEVLIRSETSQTVNALNQLVLASIDPLALVKDSYTYTFKTSINEALGKYFKALVTNAKEEKRFAKQKAKYDAKVAQGKTPSWKPVPANVLSHALLIGNISKIIDNLIELYSAKLAETSFDNADQAAKILPYLKEQASISVYHVTKSMARTMAIKLMKEVGIPEPRKRFRQYPFEFSGGMRQRIVIAIALAANPEILICDEPTTALDVTIQAQILELINQIKEQRKLSVIFITHNLGVVANMADKIAVMYAGKIVEFGATDDIFYDPRHPYTWALLASMPDLETKEKLDAIPGTPPNMIYPPEGDAFAPRNKYALNIDFKKEPPFFQISPTHYAMTWLCDPRAPKVERPKIVDARIALMKSKYGSEIDKEMKANAASAPDEAYKDIAVAIPKSSAVSAAPQSAEPAKKPAAKPAKKKGGK